MKNVQHGLKMVDPDGDLDTVMDDMGQIVPGTVVVLHNNLITALRKAYPGWEDTWMIRIDTRGGVVQIFNTAFSGQMGFTLHITEIDPEMKSVVRWAGDLFERYGIARQKGLDIRQALADVKRNNIGEAKYET
jgi:hypothetical protein